MKNNKSIKKFSQFANEQKLNEISSDLFKKAIDIAKDQENIHRTEKLGTIYFNEFIGKTIFEYGIIEDINMFAYKFCKDELVSLLIKFEDIEKYKQMNPKDKHINSKDKIWINYDIDNDLWLNIDWKISRKDSRILGKIAEKINPNTKYKESSRHFDIEGW
jgi:hypothetical protein